MNWITINVKVSRLATDMVANLLYECGSHGAVIDDPSLQPQAKDGILFDYVEIPEMKEERCIVTGYFEESDIEAYERVEKRLQEAAPFLGDYELSRTVEDEESWLHEWKKYFHPKEIAPGIIVKPHWEEYSPQKETDQIIEIDPGLAFGTGLHETTTLCAGLLQEIVKPHMKVVDVGTGTGILAIVAAKLGAKEIYALDLDEEAVKSATYNVKYNHVEEQVRVGQHDLLNGVPGMDADIVVANIVADVIILLLQDVERVLAADGRFLVSGIIDSRVDDVAQAIHSSAFYIEKIRCQKNWFALQLRKK